jgi:hypothetical protein
MQQIDSRQIEKFLREEWEKVVAGVVVIVFLVLTIMTLTGGTPYLLEGSGQPPQARKPLLNMKSSFEFLTPAPEASPLKGLELTAQVGSYTPPTCPACRHAPHQPGLCQTPNCACGKVVVPDQPTPPPPPVEKPKITKFESGITPLDPRLAFFSADAKPPEGCRIVEWKIDFGDGEIETSHNGWEGNEIRHTYKRDGQFNATLSCRSDRGGTAQRSIVVPIGGAAAAVPVSNQVNYKLTVMSYSNLNGYITVGAKLANPATGVVLGKTFGLGDTFFGITLDKADAAQMSFKGADGKSVTIKKNQTESISGVTE